MQHLMVAGIQIEAGFGHTQDNLSRAAVYIEEAARQGAQLVLMPELTPSGYSLTPELWDYAEPAGGSIETWLSETAQRLGIYLGTSYLQAERTNFYNTFAMGSPSGKIAGRVRDVSLMNGEGAPIRRCAL